MLRIAFGALIALLTVVCSAPASAGPYAEARSAFDALHAKALQATSRRYVPIFNADLELATLLTQAPDVSLSVSVSPSAILANVPVTLHANVAYIPASEIRSVEFLSDGAVIATTTVAENLQKTYSFPATASGTRSLQVRLTDTNGVVTLSPPQSATISLDLLGAVTGVVNSSGKRYVEGWACEKNATRAVQVHLHAQAGQSFGPFVADQAVNPSAYSSCGTSAAHGFRIEVTQAIAQAFVDRKVFADASIANQPGKKELSGSGQYYVNQRPVLALTATPGNVQVGGVVKLKLTVVDTDGDIQSLRFDHTPGAPASVSMPLAGGTYDWTPTAADVGTHTWTAKVTDAFGVAAIDASVSVRVDPRPNTPPTLSFGSPANGDRFSFGRAIPLVVSASDADGTVQRVVLRDGTAELATLTGPYTYNWTNAALGAHTLTATAYDNAGATTTSSIGITVITNTLPSVRLNAPAHDSRHTRGQAITLAAAASDVDGGVVRVEFYQGQAMIGSTASPVGTVGNQSLYQVAWTPSTTGTYFVRARAYDADGYSLSEPFTLHVDAPPSPQAPTVRLLQPSAMEVASGSTVTLEAEATATGGTLSRIEFLRGSLPPIVEQAPAGQTTWRVQRSWLGAKSGEYSIQAVAYDSNGLSTMTSPVNVRVKLRTPNSNVSPPSTAICGAPEVPREPGSTPTTPGAWWNPARNGTSWNLMYLDGNRQLVVAWYTYDSNRRPLWLISSAAQVDTINNVWSAELHESRWNWTTGTATRTRVGSVAMAFVPGDPTRAAITWQSNHVDGIPRTECIQDFARVVSSTDETVTPDVASSTVNSAYNGAWFEPTLSGWGINYNLLFVNGLFVETAGVTTYDDDGAPVWLLGKLDGKSVPPQKAATDIPLIYNGAGEGYPSGYPTVDCSQDGSICKTSHAGVGMLTRIFESPTTGRARLTLTGTADKLPPFGRAFTRFARPAAPNNQTGTVDIVKLSATNQILADRAQCTVPSGATTCTVHIDWTSTGQPAAAVFKRDLDTRAATWVDSGAEGSVAVALSAGERVAFELHADDSDSDSTLLSKTFEIQALAGIGVTITSPKHGDTLPSEPMTIQIAAHDADGVAHVELYDNGVLLPSACPGASAPSCNPDTTAPYSYQLNAPALGTHRFRAVLTDLESNRTESATIVINVVDTPGSRVAPPDPDTVSDSVGATVGEFDVTAMGAANYEIPLFTAPGTAGMVPKLALAYSSQRGVGAVGKGWTIGGMSSITRCRGTTESGDGENAPGVTFSSTDKFCLDGQRLLEVANTAPTQCPLPAGGSSLVVAQYRTEIETFQRVCGYTVKAADGPRFFTVESGSGHTHWYGDRRTTPAATDGGAADGYLNGNGEGQQARILTWTRTRTQDASGNYIDYRYLKNPAGADYPGELLLSEAAFTGKIDTANQTVTSEPYAKVTFNYAAARSEEQGYRAGSTHYRTHRLESITSSDGAVTLRHYRLNYGNPSGTGSGDDLLRSVQECRDASQSAVCLSPTEFTWSEPARDFAVPTPPTFPGLQVDLLAAFAGMKLGDVDGDGRKDIVWVHDSPPATPRNGGGGICTTDEIYVAFNRLDATGRPYFVNHPGFVCSPYEMRGGGEDSTAVDPSWFLFDYNGDGRDDLFLSGRDYWVGHLSIGAHRTTGPLSEQHPFAFEDVLQSAPIPSADTAGEMPQLTDLNGDGLTDLVYVRKQGDVRTLHARVMERYGPTPGQYAFRWGNERRVHEPNVCAGIAGCSYTVKGLYRKNNYHQLTDFNGDARSDLLMLIELTRTGGCGAGNGPGPGGPGYPRPHQAEVFSDTTTCTRTMVYASTVDEVAATEIRTATYANTHWEYAFGYFDDVDFADINGDGLSDLVNHNETMALPVYALNDGRGFRNGINVAAEQFVTKHMQLVDINGDGRSDLVYPNSGHDQMVVRYAKPDQVFEHIRHGVPSNGFGPEQALPGGQAKTACAGEECLSRRSLMFVDLDGDGSLEFLRIHWTPGVAEIYMAATSNRHQPRDVITAITDGLGATTEVTYLPMTNQAVYRRAAQSRNGAPMGRGTAVHDFQASTYLVAKVSSSAPAVDPATGDFDADAKSSAYFRYVGAKLQAGGRGFLGFEEMHRIDVNHPAHHIVSITGYRDDFPFIGRVHSEVTRVVSGRFAPDPCFTNVTDACFVAQGTQFPAYGGRIVADVEHDWVSAPTFDATVQRPYDVQRDAIRAASYDLATGNKLSERLTDLTPGNWGTVADVVATTYEGASDTLIGSVGTHTEYSHDTTRWILGRPTTTTTTYERPGQTPRSTTTTRTYSTQGLLTGEHVQPSGGAAESLRTFYVLDAYGNRVRSHTCSSGMSENDCKAYVGPGSPGTFEFRSDVATRIQRYVRQEFDARGRFVTKVYEPFWNGSGATEHPVTTVHAFDAFGMALHSEDERGVDTIEASGALGRPYYAWAEARPLATPGSASQGIASFTTYRRCGTAVSCPAGAVYRQQTSATAAPTTWTYFDALSRPLLAVGETFNAGVADKNFSAVCSAHDAQGRVARTSEPFFVSGTGTTPAVAADACTSNARLWTQTDYDVLGRTVRVTAPDETYSTIVYAGLTTASTDARRNPNVQTYDAYGALTRAIDAGGLVVDYAYDVSGNLASVTRTGTRGTIVSTTNYDALGRKTSESDPDAGSWTYSYNAAGEMLAQYDSAGRRIAHWYDARGRLYRKTVDSSSGVRETAHTYDFDTAPNGLGMLARDTVDGRYADWTQAALAHEFQRDYAYDGLGRPQSKTTLIDGVAYTSQVEYDAHGRPWKVQDASTRVLKTAFDARGFAASQCESSLVDSDPTCAANSTTTYRQTLEVDARGNVVRERRGGSAALDVVRTYVADNGRLERLCVGSQCAIQDESYDWDEAGNLKWRDKAGQYKETFDYDALNRLTTARYERALSQTWAAGQGPISTSLRYDTLGNICSKRIDGVDQPYTYAGRADCGTFGLPGAGGGTTASPHAVQQAAGGTFTYDSHGNQTAADYAGVTKDRYTRYTAEAQAYEIALSSRDNPSQRSRFWYGPGGERYKREDGNSNVKRTLYLGNVEITTQGGATSIKRYVAGVAVQDIVNGIATDKYAFTDHLGSVAKVTDRNGNPLEAMDFGAFGERRGATDPRLPAGAATATNRGFTGHEMLDGLDVVHMNGRIYDNRLGRFMQPDPIVIAAVPASWNGYSYVYNNPLNTTDPSGYLPAVVVVASVGSGITAAQVGGALFVAGIASTAINTAAASGGINGLNEAYGNGAEGAETPSLEPVEVLAESPKYGWELPADLVYLIDESPDGILYMSDDGMTKGVVFARAYDPLMNAIRADNLARMKAAVSAGAITDRMMMQWRNEQALKIFRPFTGPVDSTLSMLEAIESGDPLRISWEAAQQMPLLRVLRIAKPVKGAVDWMQGGRLGGKLYGADKLRQLGAYLEKRGISLKVGDEYVPAGKAGGFSAGEKSLILRSNPTNYEVWHELTHYQQFKALGERAYSAQSRLMKEQHVFDKLESMSRRWNSLQPEEWKHARWYIEWVGGLW